jgi:transcriptional regulator with XRE-family HTH domain
MARTKQTNKKLAAQLGEALFQQRQTANMTQAALAEAVDLQTETISRIENGLRLPTIEKLVDIANVFNVPVAVFFENIDAAANRQPANELYAQEISAALDKLPQSGKKFVLEVAQDYARYHVAAPKKKARKAE